jgi:hypothetical protein
MPSSLPLSHPERSDDLVYIRPFAGIVQSVVQINLKTFICDAIVNWLSVPYLVLNLIVTIMCSNYCVCVCVCVYL